MCTTNVHSELPFNCADTNGKWHPFKEYRTIYPDWLIPPDYTREASDYWKYVLVKFNERFAQEFNAKPADTFYPNKLTLRSLLEINKNSLNEEAASSVQKIPWCFLRKLFKINAECRGCTQVSNSDDNEESSDPLELDFYTQMNLQTIGLTLSTS
ncbi:hypothetical protein F7725_025938 [Dissostichus mawsoni]|uniref:Uncharacterized protein n=1 Tax=Dissostichus mawsoni TaxID=36200 RepID=A0A7J5X622_DISMA|nr:hypothetical protein F7725_025938 [Dissostichus mawsoni]